MSSELRAHIDASNKKMMQAFATKDFKTLSQLYAEDCHILPPGVPAVTGRAGVEMVFAEEASRATRVEIIVEEVKGMGADFCFERHSFNTYSADGKLLDRGKSIVIWKNVDGEWLAYIDIFNVDHHTK